MDIIEAFTLQLRIPENAARGLAGQLIGLIEDIVREKVSYGVASRIRDAVPEMIDWQTASPTLAPGSLHINELPLTTHGGDDAEFDGLLERFRISRADAPLVSSLTLQFLSSRLHASTLEVVSRSVPALSRK